MRFEPSDVLADRRIVSPSAERNKGPVAEILVRVLPAQGNVLEISSGTGQHVLHFAHAMPHIRWQPTEQDADCLTSIASWLAQAPTPNVNAPLRLDVHDDIWPVHEVAAVVCMNMIYIAPPSATEALLRGAGRVIVRGGILFLYGPFRRNGRHTSSSNETFDALLKARTRNGASAMSRMWRNARPPWGSSWNRPMTCPPTTLPSSFASAEAPHQPS